MSSICECLKLWVSCLRENCKKRAIVVFVLVTQLLNLINA